MSSDSGAKSSDEMLTPRSVYFYSILLMLIILLPFAIGVSYVLKLGPKLFSGPAEYSVLFGFGVGVLLSLLAGFLYGRVAIKEMAS